VEDWPLFVVLSSTKSKKPRVNFQQAFVLMLAHFIGRASE
jgi:hypothetical protein